MRLPGLLIFFLWTTVLTSSVFSGTSPRQKISSPLTSRTIARGTQQYASSQSSLENVVHRIKGVEDDIAKSQVVLEEFKGYFGALGFPTNIHEAQKSQEPCGNEAQDAPQGQSETGWTRFGASKCVKLVSGLSTFMNAADLCRQQYMRGTDFAHPALLSVDSTKEANDLLRLLRQHKQVTSVWVAPNSNLFVESLKRNCTELMVRSPHSSIAKGMWRSVDCALPNRVVCSKPFPVSYLEVVGKQLKGAERMEELQERLSQAQSDIQDIRDELVARAQSSLEVMQGETNEQVEEIATKAESENQELREEINLQLDNFRAELVAEVESKSAANQQELLELKEDKDKLDAWKAETEGQLESLSTELRGFNEQLEKLRSPDEESLKRLKVALQNAGVWELGGLKQFDLPKVMGVWYRLQGFKLTSKFKAGVKCVKETFSLKGNNTVDYTWSAPLINSSQKRTGILDIQVDPQSPHHWKNAEYDTWLKTDYDNWAITMECKNQSISSCSRLWILSREQTLPLMTLEILRDTAESNGFPKVNGDIFNQSSC